MIGRFSIALVFLVSILFTIDSSSATLCQAEDDVRFDVPAIVPARETFVDGALVTSSEKLVEIVIPASSQIDPSLRGSIEEFRFDIFWNRSAVAVFEYGPKTQTVSDIEGLIDIEKRYDKTMKFGLNVKGGYQDIVSATAETELSRKNGSTYHYQEVPQHDVLVASGTIKRGTGAFFQFHPSKKETLEGGRDLVVVYRVPANWRGGILQVECRASGEKKMIGPWSEPIRIGKSFVMPVYLDGDDRARALATEFAQAQQALNSRWKRDLDRRRQGAGFKHEIAALFGTSVTGEVPAQWTQYLIQTGDDRHYERYARKLSQPVRSAAVEFIEARQQLTDLAR